MTIAARPLPERRELPPRRGLSESLFPPTTRSRPEASPNATLVARVEVTATLGVFAVVVDRPLEGFHPGQYVSVGVRAGNEVVQRPYSIVSLDAARARLEFFIRRLPDGRLSNLLWAVPVGERVRIGPVKGLFMLDDADPRPRVMIGTGTGLAPLLAMLDASAERADRTPNVLIHGASFYGELAYRDRIGGWIKAGLPLDYRPTVSRPHEVRNAPWFGLTGRAETQVARLLDESPELAGGGAIAYLCGNPDMIEAVSGVLDGAGFTRRDIRVEQFHAPSSRSS